MGTCASAASAGHQCDRNDEHAVLLVRGAERAPDGQILRHPRQDDLRVHIQFLLVLVRPAARPCPGHPASILPQVGRWYHYRTGAGLVVRPDQENPGVLGVMATMLSCGVGLAEGTTPRPVAAARL